VEVAALFFVARITVQFGGSARLHLALKDWIFEVSGDLVKTGPLLCPAALVAHLACMKLPMAAIPGIFYSKILILLVSGTQSPLGVT
jgi:hypothetical protein